MSGLRQAAVALHGLHAADRALILDQLPAQDQAELRACLDELAALGFERGTLAQAVRPEVEEAEGGGDLLEAATPAQIHALLAGEPAALVARVLALQAWPWSAGLLELCGAQRRSAIRAAAVRPSPALDSFLRGALRERLAAGGADTAPTRAAPGRRGPWSRLRAAWSR